MARSNHSKHIEGIISAIDVVQPLILKDYELFSTLKVSKKGLKDFASETDLKVEMKLFETLRNTFPEYGFLVEENKDLNSWKTDYEYRWIIDSIDGTFNFLHHQPFFSISIALEHINNNNGRSNIIAGAIAVPRLNELFWAEEGKGSFLLAQGIEKRIYVSDRTNFEESISVINFLEDLDTKQKKHFLRILIESRSQIRVFGSAALEMAYLSCGRNDVLMQDGLKPWDIAAGLLLIKEAGGMISNFNYEHLSIEHKNIMAANPTLFNSLLRFMQEKEKMEEKESECLTEK